jgi:hypothetical protein
MTPSEIWALLVQIINNTTSFMSGIIGLALTLTAAFWRSASYTRLLLVAGLFSIFLSPIIAWRDTYRDLAKAQSDLARLSRPDLRASLELISLGRIEKPLRALVFTIVLRIVNAGAPSAISDWQVFIDLEASGASRACRWLCLAHLKSFSRKTAADRPQCFPQRMSS